MMTDCTAYVHDYANGDWYGCDGDCRNSKDHDYAGDCSSYGGVRCHCPKPATFDSLGCRLRETSPITAAAPAQKMCVCPISDLLTSGHQTGCPEKP